MEKFRAVTDIKIRLVNKMNGTPLSLKDLVLKILGVKAILYYEEDCEDFIYPGRKRGNLSGKFYKRPPMTIPQIDPWEHLEIFYYLNSLRTYPKCMKLVGRMSTGFYEKWRHIIVKKRKYECEDEFQKLYIPKCIDVNYLFMISSITQTKNLTQIRFEPNHIKVINWKEYAFLWLNVDIYGRWPHISRVIVSGYNIEQPIHFCRLDIQKGTKRITLKIQSGPSFFFYIVIFKTLF